MNLRPLLPSLALLLAGCVGAPDGPYPSLARRPIESGGTAANAPAPSLPTAPMSDPALDGEVAKLEMQAQAGAAAFDRAYPDAQRRAEAASKAAISSEAWVAAQVAISGLESARNNSVSALAGLDSLYTNRINALADGEAAAGADTIELARREALSTVDSQNDRLDGLKALLPQP
ncbi:MAG TPA: hypothetical protein VF509_16205 [Sphingobium sp.]